MNRKIAKLKWYRNKEKKIIIEADHIAHLATRLKMTQILKLLIIDVNNIKLNSKNIPINIKISKYQTHHLINSIVSYFYSKNIRYFKI